MQKTFCHQWASTTTVIQIVHVLCKHQCWLLKRTYVVVSKRNSMFCTLLYLHVMCKKCEIFSSSRCNLYPIGKKLHLIYSSYPCCHQAWHVACWEKIWVHTSKGKVVSHPVCCSCLMRSSRSVAPVYLSGTTSRSSHEVCWVWPLVQLSQLRFCWKQQSC